MVFDAIHNIRYSVLDAHAHLGVWYNFGQTEPTAQNLRRSIRSNGIDTLFASHTLALTGEVRRGNELCRAMREEIPSLYGYIVASPHDAPALELERCGTDPFFRGVKLHPETHGYRLTDPNCEPIFLFAGSHAYPVLVHVMSDQEISDFCTIAARYPQVNFLMGHSGGFANRIHAVRSALPLANIYFDLTASVMLEGNLEWMVANAGADRILFGTDIPFLDPKHCIGQVLYSSLSASDKASIFSETARRLFFPSSAPDLLV